MKGLSVSNKLWITILIPIVTIVVLIYFFFMTTVGISDTMAKMLYDEVQVSTSLILNADRDFYQAYVAQEKFLHDETLSAEEKKAEFDS